MASASEVRDEERARATVGSCHEERKSLTESSVCIGIGGVKRYRESTAGCDQ